VHCTTHAILVIRLAPCLSLRYRFGTPPFLYVMPGMTKCLCMLLVGAFAFRPDETILSLVGSEHEDVAVAPDELKQKFESDIANFLEGESLDRVQDFVFHEAEEPTNQFPLRTLNRHSFTKNILWGTGAGDALVEQWMVWFCPASWPQCQQQATSFEEFAEDWEAKLNTDLGTQKVRFAMVDCATDKELCNREGVMYYPTVHHYHSGRRLGAFVGAATDLAQWLQERLGIDKEEQVMEVDAPASPHDNGFAWELMLLAAIVALNAWAICHNIYGWQNRTHSDAVSASQHQQ